jgi:hypothetical protein
VNRVFPPGGESGPPRDSAPTPPARDPSTIDTLLRECRRLLAGRAYDEVISRLDVHRPAEWAALDASGAKLLRLLAQAYLGKSDMRSARDCLEHLRGAEKEKPHLSRDERAAALSDLCKCYRALDLPDLVAECQAEARRLQMGG